MLSIPLTISSAGFSCATFDVAVAHWFRERLSPMFADLLLGLSGPGCAQWTTVAVISGTLWLAWRKHWSALLTLMLTVPGGALLCEALKHWVQRPRPYMTGPCGVFHSYSFPSGHTIAATLMYVFLALQLLPRLERRRWQFMSVFTAGTLVSLVAFSRVALGAHYLTDVLAAMVLGTTWALLCWACMRRFVRQPVNAGVEEALNLNDLQINP